GPEREHHQVALRAIGGLAGSDVHLVGNAGHGQTSSPWRRAASRRTSVSASSSASRLTPSPAPSCTLTLKVLRTAAPAVSAGGAAGAGAGAGRGAGTLSAAEAIRCASSSIGANPPAIRSAVASAARDTGTRSCRGTAGVCSAVAERAASGGGAGGAAGEA